MQEPNITFTIQTVAVRDILADDYFQHRVSTHDKSVSDLREKIRSGVRFDNVDLLEKPDGKYQIIAGFQQTMATRLELGEDATIQARVYCGLSKAEAMRISVLSNKFNGTPLNRKERRNAVRCLLREDPHMTDAEIHDLTGVSLRTVAYQRGQVPGAETTVRRGRDGKFKSAKPKKTIAGNEVAKVEPQPIESSAKEPDRQLVFGGEFLEPKALAQDENTHISSEKIEIPQLDKGDIGSVPELSTLSKICRMQARELERRADFIEKLNHKSFFTEAELELIRYVAEDAEALESVDSPHWDERSEQLKAVCIFISGLLATDNEELQVVS
ncbi:hypothetical protein SH580_17060 [Coraliomargarita algicola]|uniref:ParB/Sulfiredoxin domain-containing protein n=1 Tax=Coraliomargarita algicola TaxID=3092156 RepID=A0ABZ0RIY7_9BACT|nr:hypothetical protein [Coraliomargarita sp. J2-16]WPJ95136.1 hypothetical protein SH580_17060 [Coraliomargarita sp. J2-16]